MLRRTVPWLIASALLAQGCGLFGGEPDRPRRGGRRARAEAKAEVAKDDAPIEVKLPTAVVGGEPRLVLLVVLDTVRADHTSLCGYGRPTTPVLQQLAATPRVASTCGVATPGTWTLPSHASFFTGLDPLDHRLLSKDRPLPPDVRTLAETYAAEGWQTALFSANPTLNEASGITRGFQRTAIAPGLYAHWRGGQLEGRLSTFLDALDPGKPTFLVVNLMDAHDPYPAIPAGVGWAPKQPGVDVNLKRAEGGPVGAYLTGTMPKDEEARWLKALVDTYDYGVLQADRSLARVLSGLERRGWLAQGYRAVITSDHGENLGEHRSLRHDGQPWETVARTPLLFVDTTQEAVPTFPEPVSGRVVFDLLRTGRLPEVEVPPASYAIFHDEERAWRKDAVALWAGKQKVLWAGGEAMRFDLNVDPGEERPGKVEGSPMAGELEARAERLLEVKKGILGRAEDAAMKEALERVGYVE